MSTFIGKGNLGGKPSLKHVDTKSSEQPRAVAEMRVYFDHRRPDGEGGYKDDGGFWAGVSLWGKKAETIARVLPKGRGYASSARSTSSAGPTSRQASRARKT